MEQKIIPPTPEDMENLTGRALYSTWTSLCQLIEQKYEMERLWNKGYKVWDYEYKYRRGGKTLCTLYARKNAIGFMIVFGKAEREKFETQRQSFSEEMQKIYDDATTYHDGKWMMLELKGPQLFKDIETLLLIKRKPNKK